MLVRAGRLPSAEILAVLDGPIQAFAQALEAHAAALRAAGDAFVVEVQRRDDHRRTVDGILGRIRAAYPGDRALQDTMVPDAEDDGGRSDEVPENPPSAPATPAEAPRPN